MNLQPLIDAVAYNIITNPTGFAWVCILAILGGFITLWACIAKNNTNKPS